MAKQHAKCGNGIFEVNFCNRCLRIKGQDNYRQVNEEDVLEKEFYISLETAKKCWDICECVNQ
jgi:hypothetical protein